jgi:tripartite ATP-independent transporter DctM subunit
VITGVLALILFLLLFLLILKGYPVALTLGGVSVLFALIIAMVDPSILSFNDLNLLAYRFMGTINNFVLMAVPLFIFMGIMLEKSGLAESLLETMAILLGRFKGGLAISVVIVGALLAASTGIVGATVVTMGLIALPTMLKRGYKPELATGTIASSGTLGQIIPPSIVLVLLADTISSSSSKSMVDVGSMFQAAILPGVLLVFAYIIYIIIVSRFRPEWAPAMPEKEVREFKEAGFGLNIVKAFLLPVMLIVAVLGSIFMGVASPTEAAGVGAMGAIILTMIQKKFSLDVLRQVMRETMKLTSMVFLIILGATTFTLIFRYLGGDDFLVELITGMNLTPMAFLAIVMLVIFIAGFFIDFIEIIYIFVPVVTPIFDVMEIDMLWVGVLMAMNLQTSFLTPPFGFALFYLKGVAPPQVSTQMIYRGIVPFILIQLLFLALVFFFPALLTLF